MLRVATEEVGLIDDLYIDPNLRATCHHALMLAAERDFAERVFRARDGLNVLSATPTLAQGINLPADVVLIVGETRYDTVKQRNVPIDAHEILNAAGRAGRAGHVAQGMVLVVPNDIVAYRFGAKENSLGGSWQTPAGHLRPRGPMPRSPRSRPAHARPRAARRGQRGCPVFPAPAAGGIRRESRSHGRPLAAIIRRLSGANRPAEGGF
jgi:hypothetical protein